MSMPIHIDDGLYEQAKAAAKREHRTISGQLEFWAKVGRAALDNPDLSVEFVRDTMAGLEEAKAQLTAFKPG